MFLHKYNSTLIKLTADHVLTSNFLSITRAADTVTSLGATAALVRGGSIIVTTGEDDAQHALRYSRNHWY